MAGTYPGFAAALLALGIAGAWTSHAVAAGPCLDEADPACAEMTDDPQPNAGDAAPGAIKERSFGPIPRSKLFREKPAAIPRITMPPPPPPPPPGMDDTGDPDEADQPAE